MKILYKDKDSVNKMMIKVHLAQRKMCIGLRPAGPNLDLLYVLKLNAAPFCENYAKLYFDAKHLKKGI